jgi:hypothetical protein
MNQQCYKFLYMDFDPRQFACVKRSPIRKGNLLDELYALL